MEHKEAGCKVPEGPILCINNCGFFGSAATMNMCSKCHKDMMLKEEHAQLAASSIDSIMNGSGSSSGNQSIVSVNIEVPVNSVEPVIFKAQQPSDASVSSEVGEMKVKEGPARCGACRKRVGGSSSNSVPQYAPPPTPTPPPAPKVSTSFNDVLGFGGVAPERINGRLAMFGFASAFAVEIASNEDLVTQVTNGGVPWFIFIAGLVTVASLVPLFQGVTVDSTSGKVMTSKAELWNGRLAMIGLVSLAITEFIKGGPLF